MRGKTGEALADAAYTLQTGRRPFAHRWALVVDAAGRPCGDPLRGHAEERSLELNAENVASLLELAQLWVTGAEVRWKGLYRGQRRKRVPLPSYPFERRRHWLEAPEPVPVRRALDEWFYVPSWKRSVPIYRTGAAKSGQRRWLIFADGGGLGDAVAQILKRAGEQVTLAVAGGEFARPSPECWHLRAGAPNDHEALIRHMQAVGPPDCVLHLWNVTERSDLPYDIIETTAFFSPLSLVQALARHCPKHEVEIILVANHLERVTGDEALTPSKALLRGLSQVAPLEVPTLRCRTVDIVFSPGQSERIARQLIDEVEHRPATGPVAYRDAARFVQTVEPIVLPASSVVPRVLRDRGVYLITGGSGGIGFALARYLAAAVNARLALIQRGEMAFSGSLDELGPDVLVIAADVSDRASLSAARQRIEHRFGPVNGIVHASGVSPGSLIQRKTHDGARAVLRAKVEGLQALDSVFGDAPLDFFLLCSSLTSFTHIIGQADYTAANAYLDAFATMGARPNVVSVNWDAWLEAGMAARARAAAGEHSASKDGILSAEGVEVFRRAIQAGLPQIAVSTQNLESQIQASRRVDAAALMDLTRGIAGAETALPSRARSGRIAPRNEVERRIAEAWQRTLGLEHVAIEENFFELGGNSLLAIQILVKVREEFAVELPLHSVLEDFTVEAVAEAVMSEMIKTMERSSGSVA